MLGKNGRMRYACRSGSRPEAEGYRQQRKPIACLLSSLGGRRRKDGIRDRNGTGAHKQGTKLDAVTQHWERASAAVSHLRGRGGGKGGVLVACRRSLFIRRGKALTRMVLARPVVEESQHWSLEAW